MDLGSMLHKTLERFHEIHTDFTVVTPGAAETWIADLQTLRAENWDATQYDTPLVAQAAAQRADVALRGYARSLEKYARSRPFRVEHRETPVTVQVGPHTLSGKVDRIDVDAAGGRTVIDYKSGNARGDSLAKAMSCVLTSWDAAVLEGRPRERLAGKASNDLKVQLALYATAVDRAAAVAYVYLAGAKEIPERNGAAIDLTPLGADEKRFTAWLLDELQRDVLDPLAESQLLTLPVTQDVEVCHFCAYKNICPGPEAAA
jgi:RecB family exonuclease